MVNNDYSHDAMIQGKINQHRVENCHARRKEKLKENSTPATNKSPPNTCYVNAENTET